MHVKSDSTLHTLSQAFDDLEIKTRGQGFEEITKQVSTWIREVGAVDGVLTAFLRHTSASLVIQENADPDVLKDLADCLDTIAPQSQHYHHNSEGLDDMPAHIKTMLTATSLAIPVRSGRLYLGTWQGIYVAEHRANAHRRMIALHYQGSLSAS